MRKSPFASEMQFLTLIPYRRSDPIFESETETLVASESEGLCNEENAQSLRGMCVRVVYCKSHLSLYVRFPP